MSKEIKREFDERRNLIHYKSCDYEEFFNYDKDNNLIHTKNSNHMECWYEYDINRNKVYLKINNYVCWYKFDKNNKMIYCKSNSGFESWYKEGYKEITQQEYKWIEFKKKEKEFLSRTPVSRFKLMDI